MARILGLILSAVLLASLLYSTATQATCAQVDAALANPDSCGTSGGVVRTCEIRSGSNPGHTYIWRSNKIGNNQPTPFALAYDYVCNNCTRQASYPAAYGSNIAVCNGGCMYEPQPGGTTDTVRSGSWVAQLKQATYAPTGETCAIDAPPPPPQKSPTICGGGSCHDTAGHNYCAVDSSGQQFCVPEPAPSGPGGCGSSGNTTICAGNPPPMPGNPPISDPSSDIAASDTYGHQDGSGAISNTTVNNYNNSGDGANNGAQTGDSGDAPGSDKPKPGSSNDPASSSSAGGKGDPTSASGGDNCNSPPICEGAAATCMVVKQSYLLRCPPGQTGDTSGEAGQDGNTDVPGVGDIGEGPGAGFMRAEDGLSKLDTGGLGGGGTCPTLVTFDLESYGVHMNSESLPWCDILEKVGYMILFLCAFISLRILSSK